MTTTTTIMMMVMKLRCVKTVEESSEERCRCWDEWFDDIFCTLRATYVLWKCWVIRRGKGVGVVRGMCVKGGKERENYFISLSQLCVCLYMRTYVCVLPRFLV